MKHILVWMLFFLSKSCEGYTLTTSSENATVGLDFTFTCVTTKDLTVFTRYLSNICTITGANTDGTCVFDGDYFTEYTYTCNPTPNTYTVTIPGYIMTESLHETAWKCGNPFTGGISNTKILYVNVPISSTTLLSTPTDKNRVEVVSNRKQTFSCSTNAARPSSRIQWYLSTTNITTSASPQPDVCNTDCSDDKVISSSVLTYTGNINDDGKTLYCTAINIEEQGVVRSSDKTIVIWYGPNMVIITPSTQSYTLNETDNLNQIQCTAVCIPVCTMTWSRPNLPADNTSVLNLQNINRNQAGNYQCTASNNVSSKTSVVVNVVVQYKPTSPTITQTPVGPIIEGIKVTLTCTIQGGNPVANITWSCDGDTLMTPTGSSSTIDANSSVELVTSKNNNGQTCTCTGRHLLWTNDRTQQHSIIVYYSPTVNITNMNPLDVVENITLKLACQVMDGNPTVNSFSWYKGSSTTPIGMESNFSISKVSRTNSGEYKCEGSNGIGQNGTDTVYVNVLYNPEITHLSVIDSNEILENNTATMQCNVESNPLSNMEWTFENKTLNESNPNVLQSNYTIQRAKCVDTGFYMCTATNIINMESYSDNQVVQLSVKCSPRRDSMFKPPDNQILLAQGQHLKMQIHIIAYPSPVVEWRFRSAGNSTKTLSSNCNQTNMFKHTACFEKENITENDFGNYSIFVHNGLGNNFSYLFNVDPQGPPDMSSNVNTSCKVVSADIMWTTGFHGGEKQQFYVIVVEVKTGITKIYNTHVISNEKNEDKSYNIALQPGLYRFRIFGNNSFGDATSGESTCQVNNVASESDPVIAVATGSAAAALIIGVVVVIVVLRKRMANAKGNENSDDKGRVNMTPMDGDEVVEGLQENDCYVPFQPKYTGAANYEVVERKDQSNANDVNEDSHETALYSIVDKKTSAKGATTSGEKTKDGPDENGDVYENFTNKGSSDNLKQNVNKDGLQYSQLVFNPLPNCSKFIVHGIEDKTIYAEVDTTQKIDPLPESDDEDKGNEA